METYAGWKMSFLLAYTEDNVLRFDERFNKHNKFQIIIIQNTLQNTINQIIYMHDMK